MKIKCSFCGCAIEATSEKCPHCGAANDKAAQYANQHEQTMRIKEQARADAYSSGARVQAHAKKIMIIVYGTIAVLFGLPMLVGIILAVNNNISRERERVELNKQKLEQEKEELRLLEEQEKELKAYDEEEVAVNGLNAIAQKDRYYSIQVTEAVPYELNYDHKLMEWGGEQSSDPHLQDEEHRIAIHIKVKNYQDKISIYNDPTGLMKMYIEDENSDSIVIQEESFLNGDSGDNYYAGGKMISGNTFVNNYGKYLENNQTMSWWVPVVVNENSKEIVLHFDYNMTITIDNPYVVSD